MTTFINGLNFRRNYFEDNEVAKINVEQIVEMKRQRLLEKESESNNDVLIKNLCDMKYNYDKTKCNIMKGGNTNVLCLCWYIFNEFFPSEVQENIESDGNNEINLFNKNTIDRYRFYLNENKDVNKAFEFVTWEQFKTDDKINRFICELSETDCDENVEESALLKITQEKWSQLKQYFDYLKTYSNDYLLKFLSRLCRKSISSFSISTFDLALIYGITHHSASSDRDSRPIIYTVKYKCAIDFFLIPLLFKEAGIDSPVYFVGESKQVLSMQSILNRIGYIIVRNSAEMKIPKLQTFIVEKKAEMILQSKKSICLILKDSINSYYSASEQNSEIRVLHSAVNAFLDCKLNEPIIVPLTISHEYIPKDFHLRSTSIWSYNSLKFLRMYTGQFGIVKLSICKPIYYSQFSSNSDAHESNNIINTENQLKKLVKHLSMFSDKSQSIMPTNLVAFILLYHFKEKSSVSIEEMAQICFDLNKFILSSESLGFEYSSVLTNIRRGCNMLSHCLSVSKNPQSVNDDHILKVDWDSFSVLSELDMYADVIVHKILMKAVAATAFVTSVRFSRTTDYIDQLSATSDSMTNFITNIVKIMMSRFFQFLLPCEKLDDEINKLNTWWNETMISSTKETEALYIEGEFHDDSENWHADIYDKRIRDQILMLSRCLAPRLEALNFIIVELMQNKQAGFDSMIPISELYNKFVELIKQSAKSDLRFKNCMNYDYFVSGIITLTTHEIIRIIDISTRERVNKPENIDFMSPRYAVLDSEYYNLQRWKTFIDLSLITA